MAAVVVIQNTGTSFGKYAIFLRKMSVPRSFGMSRYGWATVLLLPRKEEVHVHTHQNTLACPGATCGEHSLCRRALQARRVPWWRLWPPALRSTPSPALRPTPQVWARPPRLSPFLWGDILRRTPGMGCSRALHWRGPGSPRCTSVVLLHGPGGLLSRSVSVHGALDSGSAFRVAVRGLAGAPDVRVLARYVVWPRHTFSEPAIQVGSEPPSPVD